MIIRAAGARRPASAMLVSLVLAGCSAAPSQTPSGTPVDSTPSPGHSAAVAATAPASAASPTATAMPTAGAWERLASFQMGGQAVGMAAGPAGYVVLEHRTVWFSSDGRSWTRTGLPFEGGSSSGIELRAWANEIVSGGPGFLVVGGQYVPPCQGETGAGGPPPCSVVPIAWVSDDGVNWRSTESNPIPSDGSALPAYSEIVHAWAAAGGWDAAVEARDSPRYHGNTLLRSADGLRWSRLKPAPLPSGASSGDEVFAHAGVGTEDGRRVVWQVVDPFDGSTSPSTSLATSLDGTSWAAAPQFDGEGVVIRLGLGPDGGAGRWLILGDVVDGGAHATRSWASDDLVGWRQSGERDQIAGWLISDIVPWAGGFLAVGSDRAEASVRALFSADGLTWSEVAGSSGTAPDLPMLLASGPAGLIGIGVDDYRAQAWLAAGS